MKTLKQVTIDPVFVDLIPETLEPNQVYICEQYKVSVHACLCGCGEKTILPLTAGQWELIKHSSGKVSFTPSIGNYSFPCRSHYIMTKNVANFV